MDSGHFDTLTRALGRARTRRGFVRALGAALGVSALAGRAAAPQPAAADWCSYEGCNCYRDPYTAADCAVGLVCCKDGIPADGEIGVCTSMCGVQCISPGDTCATGCPYNGDCYGCCSGQCLDGICTYADGTPGTNPYCPWEGCPCSQDRFSTTGCNDGLTCCGANGLPVDGGDGVCTSMCGVQCISPGRACTEGCPWYGPCFGCCSGQCENGYCTRAM